MDNITELVRDTIADSFQDFDVTIKKIVKEKVEMMLGVYRAGRSDYMTTSDGIVQGYFKKKAEEVVDKHLGAALDKRLQAWVKSAKFWERIERDAFNAIDWKLRSKIKDSLEKIFTKAMEKYIDNMSEEIEKIVNRSIAINPFDPESAKNAILAVIGENNPEIIIDAMQNG